MRTCAIDIHHHYFPPGVVVEVKSHGKALGVEVDLTKEGLSTVSIGGAPSHAAVAVMPWLKR